MKKRHSEKTSNILFLCYKFTFWLCVWLAL